MWKGNCWGLQADSGLMWQWALLHSGQRPLSLWLSSRTSAPGHSFQDCELVLCWYWECWWEQVRNGVMAFSPSKHVWFKTSRQLIVNLCNSSSHFHYAASLLAGPMSGLWGAPVMLVFCLEKASLCCRSYCSKWKSLMLNMFLKRDLKFTAPFVQFMLCFTVWMIIGTKLYPSSGNSLY